MGSAPPQSRLFESFQLGTTKPSNRVVLAPLTRNRVSDTHVILPMAREYYTQRASTPGTFLITEATAISPKASGYPNIPGIWNDEQVQAWKYVVDGVHNAGGVIYLQLWALGRVASKAIKDAEGTGDIVSSSAVAASDQSPVPRALTEEEIWEYVADFAKAAKRAVHEVGFDGVEIHAANGYLVDQFIQDVANKRTDRWGGSIENRSRFAVEISRAVAEAVGADKTAIRLSPFSVFQAMKMDDPIPQFSHLLRELKKLNLAYLHLVEARIVGNTDCSAAPADTLEPLIDIWAGTSPILLAGGFTPESARKAVDETYKDKDVAVVFGRRFISTPDLVFRMRHGLPLNEYDRDTFYLAKSEKGYLDYPFSQEWIDAASKTS